MANFLVIPIKMLVSGTAEIAKGHFETRLPAKSNDEIGDLTSAVYDIKIIQNKEAVMYK